MKRIGETTLPKTDGQFTIHCANEIMSFGAEELHRIDRVVNQQDSRRAAARYGLKLLSCLSDLAPDMVPDCPGGNPGGVKTVITLNLFNFNEDGG